MRIALYPNRMPFPPADLKMKRQIAIDQFKNIEFDLNEGLQGIVKLAAEICNTSIALITLVDREDLHLKVRKGVDVCSIPSGISFCAHAIEMEHVMVVEDASIDKRFSENPIVTQGPKIRFYAGAPLTNRDGHTLGTLCVLDTHPKILSENKKNLLTVLADQAMHLMELQLSTELMKQQMADIDKQNQALTRIAFIQSHEFRSPVASIMGLMNLIKDEGYSNSEEYFRMMEEVVKNLDEKIHLVVASTALANGAYIA